MYAGKRISVVIPCFNEESGLLSLLKHMPKLIDETIVVDNASTDNTTQVGKNFGAKVIYLKKRGYGLSYRNAFVHVTGDIVVTMDGDNSYPLDAIENMLIQMEKYNLDFMSGNRFPLKHPEAMPFINKIANISFSWLIRRLFKVNIRDSQSGMWVFRRTVLEKIISDNCGMGFSQEIKLKAWLNPKIRCAEIHIDYQKRVGSTKFRKSMDSIKNLRDLLLFYAKINEAKINEL